jgi:Leucine-rich repeat (LRR) protein
MTNHQRSSEGAMTAKETNRHSNLTALPESLGILRNLRYLDVGANNLKTLPAHLAAWPNLEKFDLRWNKLSEIPAWLS